MLTLNRSAFVSSCTSRHVFTAPRAILLVYISLILYQTRAIGLQRSIFHSKSPYVFVSLKEVRFRVVADSKSVCEVSAVG